MAKLTSAALLAYPLVLHICLSTDRLSIAVYYLSATLMLPLLAGLLGQHRISSINLLCVALALGLLSVLDTRELVALKLLPVMIHAALFGLFAGSLRPGETPVIARIAAAMRPRLAAAEVVYARSVTLAWAMFFLIMGIVSSLLAIFASTSIWSWFVNVASYFLVGLFFVIEFMFRRRVLAEYVDYGFVAFMLSLARTDVRRFFRYR